MREKMSKERALSIRKAGQLKKEVAVKKAVFKEMREKTKENSKTDRCTEEMENLTKEIAKLSKELNREICNSSVLDMKIKKLDKDRYYLGI
jgi:DNA-binding transcriptional regulator GbsR (MarR family)